MKNIFITSFLVILYLNVNAQFSVSAKYSVNTFPEWEEFIDGTSLGEDAFLENGIEYGLSYWLRLKNYRVEFLPEISFQNNKSQEEDFQEYGFEKTSYYLNLSTQIYLFDIEGDCNCPTWGKEGNFIQKGFFIGINPSIGYHNLNIKSFMPTDRITNQFNFRLGASAGVDVGITKWITITPQIGINYTPSLGWENLENIVSGGESALATNDSKIWEIQPGLRLMFRPDYLKEQRGMFR